MANDPVVDQKVIRAIDPSGNVLNLRVDANGNLITTTSATAPDRVQVADGTTPTQLLAVDANGRITVAAIVGALPAGSNAIGTVDTELPAAAALGDALGNPTAPAIGGFNLLWGGSNWRRQRDINAGDGGSTGIAAAGMFGCDGTNWQRKRTATIFKSQSAVNTNAEITIWTPAAGKKFRVMGYHLTSSVAGNITLRDNTGGTTIIVIPSGAGGSGIFVDLGDGILSAAANNVLTAQGPLTSTMSGMVFGTEE